MHFPILPARVLLSFRRKTIPQEGNKEMSLCRLANFPSAIVPRVVLPSIEREKRDLILSIVCAHAYIQRGKGHEHGE